MNRRVALKSLAWAAIGAMVLPGCDTRGWNEKSVQTADSLLSPEQRRLLAEITETFIPATDTPGAKELGVHQYIQKIVADCYDEEVQAKFVKELDGVQRLAKSKFGKSFAEGSSEERALVFEQMEASSEEDQQAFYALVKELTIQGYMTSEYVMTKLTKYEMVPGRYLGCVRASSKNI